MLLCYHEDSSASFLSAWLLSIKGSSKVYFSPLSGSILEKKTAALSNDSMREDPCQIELDECYRGQRQCIKLKLLSGILLITKEKYRLI